jgi:hypothetical protein
MLWSCVVLVSSMSVVLGKYEGLVMGEGMATPASINMIHFKINAHVFLGEVYVVGL